MKTVNIAMVHKVIHPPKNGDIILQITDVQAHTSSFRTFDFAKTVEKSTKKKEGGRLYSTFSRETNQIISVFEDGVIKSTLPYLDRDQLTTLVEKYKSEGKRVYLAIPKDIMLSPGKDAVEFMNSKNGKRLARGMNKNN
jgi:hypothetical protein